MFENLEQTLTTLQEQSNKNSALLTEIVSRLNGGIDPDEPLINSKTLMDRLGISEPTLIRMRRQKKISFIDVGGTIRYDWAAVKKSLTK